MTYSSLAIVLGYREWREHDRLYTLYSKEFGKIEAVATGTRKMVSKLAPHLEPLTISECMFAQGRYVERLIQATSLHRFGRICTDLDRLTRASFCSELLDRLTQPGVADVHIFDLLRTSLDTIEKEGADQFDPSWFTVRLFRLLGFGIPSDAKEEEDTKALAKEYFLMHPEVRPRSADFLDFIRTKSTV